MNAVPSQRVIDWAEALGEAIGRGIANQLRGQVARIVSESRQTGPARANVNVVKAAAAPAPAPRRRGRPPGSKNKVREPAKRPVGLPKLARERVDGFKQGELVKFEIDGRTTTGEILGLDALAGELLLKDVSTGKETRRRPSQVNLAKSAPVTVRKRQAPIPAPVLVESEEEPAEAPAAETSAQTLVAAAEALFASPEPSNESTSEGAGIGDAPEEPAPVAAAAASEDGIA